MTTFEIGERVTGITTSNREVTGKIIGRDPRPLKHADGEYLVVKEDGTGAIVYMNVEKDRDKIRHC